MIKYILKLDGKEYNNESLNEEIIQEENFISFKNKKIPYLKLIEFKGIGLDKMISPEQIEREALECIKNKISVKRNNNKYTEFINCIWYCVTGSRLEEPELKLLKELSSVYNNKQIPIILVYSTEDILNSSAINTVPSVIANVNKPSLISILLFIIVEPP